MSCTFTSILMSSVKWNLRFFAVVENMTLRPNEKELHLFGRIRRHCIFHHSTVTHVIHTDTSFSIHITHTEMSHQLNSARTQPLLNLTYRREQLGSTVTVILISMLIIVVASVLIGQTLSYRNALILVIGPTLLYRYALVIAIGQTLLYRNALIIVIGQTSLYR